MQQILEKALKVCDAAEVFRVGGVSTPVDFQNSKLKSIDTNELLGVAIRVVKDGKVGFSSTTKPQDVDVLVENALATARFGAEAVFSFPGPAQCASVLNHDPGVVDLPVEDMVETGNAIIEALSGLHKALLTSVSMRKSEQVRELMNSSGLHLSHKRTTYSMSVTAEITEDENFLFVYDGVTSASASLDIGDVLRRLSTKIKDGQRNVALPSGNYPVIITPLALGDILRPVLSCVNGTAVQKGFSPWKHRLGDQLASERFSLFDEPLRKNAPSSLPFDGEGVPTRQVPIIDEGVLKNFLLDLRTASLLGKHPTGSAARGVSDNPPSIGAHSVVMAPGDTPLGEMLGSIKKGVLVDLMMGAWSGNPFGGVVSGNIMLGFVVENGEITGRCKDAMLTLNVFEALKARISAVSSERIDYGDSLLPYVLFDGLSISARG